MSESAACPVWLDAPWQSLMGRHQAGRMPHALLICGPAGIGKRRFTRSLIRAMLCRQSTNGEPACNRCDACVQLAADSHPDYLELAPEGAGNSVRIDAVRHLTTWLTLTAEQGSYKLAFIDCADTMSIGAANSLLKTLEEPPKAALVILLADRPTVLPATVRSRCQRIQLGLSARGRAIDWLARRMTGDDPTGMAEALLDEAGGAPLHALALLDDTRQSEKAILLKAWEDLFLHRASVGRIASAVGGLPAGLCLKRFAQLTALIVRRRHGVPVSIDPATMSVVSRTQNCLNGDEWFTIYRQILYLYRIDSASFKTQAVLEGLLADMRSRIGR